MRGLYVDVYRTSRLGDCTNGGISSKYDRLLLIGVDGPEEVDMDNLPENAVKVSGIYLAGEYHYHVRPVKGPDPGCVGWMYGGNIAHCSDSRFPHNYPLRIHDRQETTELYEQLSR